MTKKLSSGQKEALASLLKTTLFHRRYQLDYGHPVEELPWCLMPDTYLASYTLNTFKSLEAKGFVVLSLDRRWRFTSIGLEVALDSTTQVEA